MEQKHIWGIICSLMIPRFRIAWFPNMLVIALLGSLIAGLYGILHDQVTFTLSPEYYTEVKYYQFHYLPEHVPDRVRVGMIGFLATAAMGGICGWFLSRIVIPRHPFPVALRLCLRSFVLLFLITLTAGILGYVVAPLAMQNTSKWEPIGYMFGVQDISSFVTVAIIHQAGYIGAFTGLICSGIRLRRMPSSYEENHRERFGQSMSRETA